MEVAIAYVAAWTTPSEPSVARASASAYAVAVPCSVSENASASALAVTVIFLEAEFTIASPAA